MAPFPKVELAPLDPVLLLNDAFNADSRPAKVNLCIGVYTDKEGRIPLLRAVREAERARIEAEIPRAYLPMDGIAAYGVAVQKILFGNDSALIEQNRIVTVQSLGGTGALRIGADFLKHLTPDAKVAVSNPSWENHRALFQTAGFEVLSYPYYRAEIQDVDFDGLSRTLNTYTPGTIIVLHACCHNPTGADLSTEQWQKVIQIVKERQLIPFFDMAYQGFGAGIDEDTVAVKLFAEAGINGFIASSFSKSFSLYGERVGALSVVTSSQDEAMHVMSQLKHLIYTSYSGPPTHGGAIVTSILSKPELRSLWAVELSEMRNRILSMRSTLVTKLKQYGAKRDFNFVNRQRGMFSYSGISAQQIERLKTDFGIYIGNTGRICVAALNEKNIETVARAIAHVLNATV